MRARNAVFALVGAAALFLVGGPVLAQVAVPEPYATQLARELARHEEDLDGRGFQRIGSPFTGGLATNEAQRFNMMLRAGLRYYVVGVCDADCRNLDMRLIDQHGNVITFDEMNGRSAVVSSQPRWTGPFSIEIVMRDCREGICYFAFAVYGQ